MNIQAEAAASGPGTYTHSTSFAVLPADVSKAKAVEIVVRALRILGANSGVCEAFRLIADATARSAWHEGGTERPICWRPQTVLAAKLHVTERQMRRYEAQLARLGVIARSVADNGYRGLTKSGPLGLDVTPSIANWSYLAGLVAEAEAYEASCYDAHLLVRTTRRRIRDMIAGLSDLKASESALIELAEIERELAPALRREASLDDLTAYRMALLSFEDQLLATLEPCEASGDNEAEIPSGMHQNVRRTGHECPSSLQPTNLTSYESCNAVRNEPTSMRPSGKPDDANSNPQPHGRGAGLENNDRGGQSIINPKLLATLTKEKVVRCLMSEDFAMYLEVFSDPSEATLHMLRELGINASAWERAVNVMGWNDAYISLCVIDRNRFHPERPVISVGGTLRRFTDLYSRGELQLTRSILSILERDRAGTQLRARPRGRHDA